MNFCSIHTLSHLAKIFSAIGLGFLRISFAAITSFCLYIIGKKTKEQFHSSVIHAISYSLVKVCHAGRSGPIKLAQAIAGQARRLPPEVSKQFSTLLDKCPPHTTNVMDLLSRMNEAAKDVVYIDPIPLGCGSCAQTHRVTMRLPNGSHKDIAVKFAAPDLRSSLDVSFGFLIPLLRLGVRQRIIFLDETKLVNFILAVKASVLKETDMKSQLAHQKLAFDTFRHDVPPILIAEPYPHWSSPTCMAMELLHFVSVQEFVKRYKDQPQIREGIAKSVVRFFKVFSFNKKCLQPDMHCGNVGVDIRDPRNPMLCLLDYGICFDINDHQVRDFSHFISALLLLNEEAISRWFLLHLCCDKTGKHIVKRESSERIQLLGENIKSIVMETLSPLQTSNPSWIDCGSKLRKYYEQNNLYLDDLADQFFLGLVHIQGVVEELLPEENAIAWMQKHSKAYTEDLELMCMEDEDDELDLDAIHEEIQRKIFESGNTVNDCPIYDSPFSSFFNKHYCFGALFTLAVSSVLLIL